MKFAFLNVFALNGLENLIILSLFNIHSKINLVMKIEVNNDVKIPMIKVVANPKIGPEPNNANTTPDKKVVN